MKSRRKRLEEMKRANRSVKKMVRLTPEEDKAFSELAENRWNTDFSELVRQLLHRELKAAQEKPAA